MTTEKQIEANKKNAMASTGPTTKEGKSIVSQNALKHGILSKEVVITTGEGVENREEFQALLDNLIQSLSPNNQMELILIEKVAVDIWRLRRIIRYETGSIRQFSDTMITNYYGNTSIKSNEELDEDISELKESLYKNTAYLDCLKKGVVNFNYRTWENGQIVRDIEEDIYQVFTEFGHALLDNFGQYRFKSGKIDFDEMHKILRQRNYTDKHITCIIMHRIESEIEEYQKDIAKLENQKKKNSHSEEIIPKLHGLPFELDQEKIIRYERYVQKSIYQNLAMLKTIQSSK